MSSLVAKAVRVAGLAAVTIALLVPSAAASAGSRGGGRLAEAAGPTAVVIEVRPTMRVTQTAFRDSSGTLHYGNEYAGEGQAVKTFNLFSAIGWLLLIGGAILVLGALFTND